MNWYLKTIIAQVAEGKTTGMMNYLQSLGVSQDVIDYILLQNKNSAQYLIGQIRNNPSMTIQDIQGVSQPQQIDPYLGWERTTAKRTFETGTVLEKWLLTSFRKLRKGIVPSKPVVSASDMIALEEVIGGDNYINYVTFYGKLNEILDWYNAVARGNPNFDIASYSPEQAIAASDEWHQAMSSQGEGLVYDEAKHVLYGPQWQNPDWNGWTIQSVTSENDLLVEGNEENMNHCVGDYCDRVDEGHSIIYSLRDPQNKPHVTIETNGNNEIVQIMGKSNSEPKDIYKAMIKEWIQSPNNPGINSFEDDDDPMDEVRRSGYSYGGEMEELLNILEGLEGDEYGITQRTTWDADDIARRAIEIEMGSREPEYRGELTRVPQAIVSMIVNDKESSPEYINHQLSKFEDYLQELEEEIEEMAMQWDYYGDYPIEEDYETPEEFKAAKEEYEQNEQEYRDEEIQNTPQGGFAHDGYKIINDLAEKGIYQKPATTTPQLHPNQ